MATLSAETHEPLCSPPPRRAAEQEKALEKVLEQLGIHRLGVCKSLISGVMEYASKQCKGGVSTSPPWFFACLFWGRGVTGNSFWRNLFVLIQL